MHLEISQGQQADHFQYASLEQRDWMVDPWSKVPTTDTLSNISFFKGTRRSRPALVDPNAAVKLLRRDIIEGDVEINVIGLSGAGKSQILEGLNDLLDRDEYLAEVLRKRSLKLTRRTIPFSMGIKAAQIPEERGGPGIIPLVDQDGKPLSHGGFTDSQYSDASKFIGEAAEEVSRNKRPNSRVVKFREAPGMPYVPKRGAPVRIEGMADRGNSPIYNSVYSPDRKGKYLFIVVRQENVAEVARVTRGEFDPDGDMKKVFNSGVDYVATNRYGVVERIADQPEIQRDVVRFLKIATASEAAIKRSNWEYYRMVADLQSRGIIPDTEAMSYASALRNRLMSGGSGLPGDQIYLVSNLYSKSLGEKNTYNLDYFLKDNYWALKYREELVPQSLCERYLPAA